MLKAMCGDLWRDELSDAGRKMAETPCWRDSWSRNVEVTAPLVADLADWVADYRKGDVHG